MSNNEVQLATKAPLWFRVINGILMSIIAFAMIYPFLYMLAVSFSSSTAVLTGRVGIIPVDFSTEAYKQIMGESKFWTGYRNTVIYTFLGTTIALFVTITCAYPLSRKDLVGRTFISKLIVFTMFFNGGLIPFYLVMKGLGLVNTMWALILPGSANAFYVIVMRTFFQGIPDSLVEAAEIDGLSQLGILIRIIIPLSKPIIATIALFNAVWYWNDWFNALIFLTKDSMYPVTMYLRNIMLGVTLSARSGQTIDATSTGTISQTLQAASTMLVVVPMLIIYPRIQKYFVKGIMIGSIKG